MLPFIFFMANGEKRKQIYFVGKGTCISISTVTCICYQNNEVYHTCILSLIALAFFVFRSFFVSKMASCVLRSFWMANDRECYENIPKTTELHLHGGKAASKPAGCRWSLCTGPTSQNMQSEKEFVFWPLKAASRYLPVHWDGHWEMKEGKKKDFK